MDRKNMKGDYKVTQSNFLVEANHKTPFTLQEVRLLLTMVSMIEINQKEFHDYTFSVTEFSQMLGMAEPKYHSIKSALHKLAAKTVEFNDPDPNIKDEIITNWFDEIRYKKGSGEVSFIFHRKLRPYLLELKKDFSSYRLQYVLILKSSYAIRLYELGQKWSGRKQFEYSLEDLKLKIGATKKSYDSYGTFKQKILMPSVNEINEKTDLTIDLEEIKSGRKVVGIRFAVTPKEQKRSKSQKQLGNPPTSPKFGRNSKFIREEPKPDWLDTYNKEMQEKDQSNSQK